MLSRNVFLIIALLVVGGLSACSSNHKEETPTQFTAPATSQTILYDEELKNGNDIAPAGEFKGDTDGDGLSDYEEYYKYRTDHTKDDSDGDGVLDNDWNERCEYSETIRAKCSIAYPYDLETMNDHFQDVRIIKEEKDILTYEVILYPDAKLSIKPSEYPVALPPDIAGYTRKTTLFNYSDDMQDEIKNIVANCKTDLEVARTIINWVQQNTIMPVDNSGPVNFRYGVRNGEIIKENDGWIIAETLRNWSEEKILETFVYGDSMFENRTHGTCDSAAILVCTMLRAAGIPVRTAVSVPINPASTKFTSHFWNEIYIGGQWLRADAWRGVNVPMISPYLFVKVMSFEDYEHINFASTWGTKYSYPSKDRPYFTFEYEAQSPIH